MKTLNRPLSLAATLLSLASWAQEPILIQGIRTVDQLESIKSKFQEKDGGWSSGGGHAVVCFKDFTTAQAFTGEFEEAHFQDGVIESITQYDLYVAQNSVAGSHGNEPIDNPFEFVLPQDQKPSLILAKPGESYRNYFLRLASRLEFVEPELASRVKQFASKSSFTQEPSGLGFIPDFEPQGGWRKNCIVAQLARQHVAGGAIEISYDPNLFDHPAHSNDSRASLLMHEYLYAIGKSRGQKTSFTTRALVKTILRSDSTLQDFRDRATAFGLSLQDSSLGKNFSDIYDLTVKFILDSLTESEEVAIQAWDSDMKAKWKNTIASYSDIKAFIQADAQSARRSVYELEWKLQTSPKMKSSERKALEALLTELRSSRAFNNSGDRLLLVDTAKINVSCDLTERKLPDFIDLMFAAGFDNYADAPPLKEAKELILNRAKETAKYLVEFAPKDRDLYRGLPQAKLDYRDFWRTASAINFAIVVPEF